MKEGKSRDREERKGMGEGRGKREMGQEWWSRILEREWEWEDEKGMMGKIVGRWELEDGTGSVSGKMGELAVRGSEDKEWWRIGKRECVRGVG